MISILLLGIALHGTVLGEERADTLTYAVFPYLPDMEYYQELIEERWAELEPDIYRCTIFQRDDSCKV